MAHQVTLIPGDGVGPELAEATRMCIDATGVAIDWDVQEAGVDVMERLGTPVPDSVLESCRRTGVALKAPITTPVGTGFRSVNVYLRQALDLFACVRPCKQYSGVRSFFESSKIDLVIVRENTEDLYIGCEFEKGKPETAELIADIKKLNGKILRPDSGISIKPISVEGSRRIVKYAFDYARKHGRKKVTAVHKANILKYSDGLFLEVSREVAKGYTDIEFEDRIVDNMCMQLVQKPELYDVMVLPNLYGDILSDLCAGLVGGLGVAPGANIGDKGAVFEATHGSAPKYKGQWKMNPTALILSGALMLEYLGETEAAKRLEKGVADVIKAGKDVTYDLKPHRDDPTAVGTKEMARAIIKAMGASRLARRLQVSPRYICAPNLETGWMSVRRFDEAAYLRLVRGETSGPAARLGRFALGGASMVYGLGVGLRNVAFDRGWKEVHKADLPVVSVGNLTLGGTGKTPMVEWIARWYRSRDVRVSILSRGYGQSDGLNDEGRVLEDNLPDVPHLQGADRVALARIAFEELESQLVVLDDGFQHRRLARDLDVVLLDSLEPFGLGRLSPRGLLRERASALRRAGVVVLTRADLIDKDARVAIRAHAERRAGSLSWGEARHAPLDLTDSAGVHVPLSHLGGKTGAAFCGIGNPAGFRRTLEALEVDLVDFRAFPDHHIYSSRDVSDLTSWVRGSGADLALTTQKDLVKLRVPALGPIPLHALRIGLEIMEGQGILEEALSRLLPTLT